MTTMFKGLEKGTPVKVEQWYSEIPQGRDWPGPDTRQCLAAVLVGEGVGQIRIEVMNQGGFLWVETGQITKIEEPKKP